MNVAVTDLAADMLTVQVVAEPAPEQEPPQPVKLKPEAGVTDSETVAPDVKVVAHVPLLPVVQLIELVRLPLLEMVPLAMAPPPVMATSRLTVDGAVGTKVAPTVLVPSMGTAQVVLVPEQWPSHPVKVYPAVGRAVRV